MADSEKLEIAITAKNQAKSELADAQREVRKLEKAYISAQKEFAKGNGGADEVKKLEAAVKGARTEVGRLKAAYDKADVSAIKLKHTADGVGGGWKRATGFVKDHSAAIAAAGLAMSAGLAMLAKTSLKATETWTAGVIGMKRATGGTVEDVSRLRFALEQSGVNADQVSRSIGMFGRNLVQASASTEKTAAMTAKLGTSFTDASGAVLPLTELLPKVAARFQQMPDGAEKSALAMELFGRNGMALLPFLNKGEAGVRDLMAATEEYGLVLTQQSIDDFAKYRVAQRRVQASLKGLEVQIGSNLMPVVADGMDKLSGMLHVISGLPDPVRDTALQVAALGAAATLALPVVVRLGSALTGVGTALEGMGLASAGSAFTAIGGTAGALALAVAALAAGFEFVTRKLGAFGAAWRGISYGFVPFLSTLDLVIDNMGPLGDAVDWVKEKFGQNSDAADTAASSVKDFGLAASGSADAASEATRATQEYTDALDALGSQVTTTQALIAVKEGWKGLRRELLTGRRTLNLNTREGQRNAKQLAEQASKIDAYGRALKEQEVPAAEAARKTAILRKRLEDQAVAAGMSRKRVRELIGSVKELGQTNAKPSIELTGIDKVKADLQDVWTLVTNIYSADGSAGAPKPKNDKGKTGDTATPHGVGDLSQTMAAHRDIARTVGNRVSITSSVRGWNLGSRQSDHLHGRALDLVGPGVSGYAAEVRRRGGFAQMHGSGPNRHLHAVPNTRGATHNVSIAVTAPASGDPYEAGRRAARGWAAEQSRMARERR